jgi:hypothetical protein
MAQFPRVTIHLEMTSTDTRAEYDADRDLPLWEMDVVGKQYIEHMLRSSFGEFDGSSVNITRLDVSHDLEERAEEAAA